MTRLAWLTPNPVESGETICVKMMIPAGERYAAAFRGALAPLMDETNWEQDGVDGEYPAVSAEFFQYLWNNFWEPWEENCVVANRVGQIFAWGGDSAPSGALACDGSQVAQSAYPELYAILGTIWGSADSGNFRLPDLSSRVPIGAGTGSGLTTRAVGDQGGEESHTLVVNELPTVTFDFDHNHELQIESIGVSEGTWRSAVRALNPTPNANLVTDGVLGGLSDGFGSDDPHQNMPPFLAVLFCVWATP